MNLKVDWNLNSHLIKEQGKTTWVSYNGYTYNLLNLGWWSAPDITEVGLDGPDKVMLAVGIPVEDVDLEGPVVISVAEISNF